MFTFISYAYGNVKAFRMRSEDVQKRLLSKVMGHLEQQLQANLVKLELGETFKPPGMVGLLTELHDANYHVDAVVASKLASCEETAIEAFAASQGIPASIVSLTIAVFRHDKRAIVKALADFAMPRTRHMVVDKSSVAERDSREFVPAMYRFMAFMDSSHEQEAAITEILESTGLASGNCTLEANTLIKKATQQLKECKLAPNVCQAINAHLYSSDNKDRLSVLKQKFVPAPKQNPVRNHTNAPIISTADRNEQLRQDRSERAKEMKTTTENLAAAMKTLAEAAAIDKGISKKRQDLDAILLAAVFALAEGETGKFMQYLRTKTPLTLAQEQLLRRMAETRVAPNQQAVHGLTDDPVTSASISLDRIFSVVDADSSGYIDPPEFAKALRAMGVTITDERALQIFSRCDKDHSGLLDPREFARAVEKTQKDVVRYLMGRMGMGRLRSTTILILLIAAIAALLFFIYLGVEAFGTGGEFAAVINSLLPISIGLFMGFAERIGWVDVDRVLYHLVSDTYLRCISLQCPCVLPQDQKIEDALRTQAAGI
jgi:Ca2+-binding EF-hand superfamily protein